MSNVRSRMNSQRPNAEVNDRWRVCRIMSQVTRGSFRMKREEASDWVPLSERSKSPEVLLGIVAVWEGRGGSMLIGNVTGRITVGRKPTKAHTYLKFSEGLVQSSSQ